MPMLVEGQLLVLTLVLLNAAVLNGGGWNQQVLNGVAAPCMAVTQVDVSECY